MTIQEERRERLFWRAFWVLAVLSLTTVALARPYMPQPEPATTFQTVRG